ncbi:MAG: hypothetical protein JWQ87_4078 [Candidatus Sulfotelmatobacter sp.]|nr:hypothetical protein [Candidatus Sulfotelmatobacter sp.]
MSINDVPRCQHVKVNGTQCGSPALRRKRYCYFHDSYRHTRARLMEEELEPRVYNFPLLEDANSVQVAVMHVIHSLGSGKMDTKVAGLMLYALQTASANIKHLKFEAEQPTDVVIDQDTLDLTCIHGPQWFDRDFNENAAETTHVPPAAKLAEPRDRAKLRKRPDPVRDTEDGKDSLAGLLLQRLGLMTPDGEMISPTEPTSPVIEAEPVNH